MKEGKRRILRYLTGLLLVLLALGGILLMLAGSLAGVASVAAAAVAVSLLWKWADTRCPNCRCGFSLGAAHREELEREEISLQESVPYRADDKRANFSLERTVPGTRVIYREERRCRRCGKVTLRTVVVNQKRV